MTLGIGLSAVLATCLLFIARAFMRRCERAKGSARPGHSRNERTARSCSRSKKRYARVESGAAIDEGEGDDDSTREGDILE